MIPGSRRVALLVGLVVATALSGCDVSIIDDKTSPIRSDLADAQAALTVNCEARQPVRGEGQWGRLLTDGHPLLEQYARRPDAVFRYYGDGPETTARQEVRELLSWVEERCPETAVRIRNALRVERGTGQ